MEANVDIPQVAVTNQDGEVLSDETDELNQEVKKCMPVVLLSLISLM